MLWFYSLPRPEISFADFFISIFDKRRRLKSSEVDEYCFGELIRNGDILGFKKCINFNNISPFICSDLIHHIIDNSPHEHLFDFLYCFFSKEDLSRDISLLLSNAIDDNDTNLATIIISEGIPIDPYRLSSILRKASELDNRFIFDELLYSSCFENFFNCSFVSDIITRDDAISFIEVLECGKNINESLFGMMERSAFSGSINCALVLLDFYDYDDVAFTNVRYNMIHGSFMHKDPRAASLFLSLGWVSQSAKINHPLFLSARYSNYDSFVEMVVDYGFDPFYNGGVVFSANPPDDIVEFLLSYDEGHVSSFINGYDFHDDAMIIDIKQRRPELFI